MTVKTYFRGRDVEWRGGQTITLNGNHWYYVGTNELASRDCLCVRCGCPPTQEGYDACLGHIDGAISACCGHGVEEKYIVMDMVAEHQDHDMIETLADLAHQQWSGWMEYLFSKCSTGEDGTLIIPSWAVTRWKRQMDTPYRDLTETEKELDRKEARKVYDKIEFMFTYRK